MNEFEKKMKKLAEERNDITTYDCLKDFAIHLLQKDQVGFALHILNAIYNSYGISDWFLYDYSTGTTTKPIPIDSEADIQTYIKEEK